MAASGLSPNKQVGLANRLFQNASKLAEIRRIWSEIVKVQILARYYTSDIFHWVKKKS